MLDESDLLHEIWFSATNHKLIENIEIIHPLQRVNQNISFWRLKAYKWIYNASK